MFEIRSLTCLPFWPIWSFNNASDSCDVNLHSWNSFLKEITVTQRQGKAGATFLLWIIIFQALSRLLPMVFSNTGTDMHVSATDCLYMFVNLWFHEKLYFRSISPSNSLKIFPYLISWQFFFNLVFFVRWTASVTHCHAKKDRVSTFSDLFWT